MRYFLWDLLLVVFATSLVGADTSDNTSKETLLPSKRDCGHQNENDAAINEFPWVAGLVYEAESVIGNVSETMFIGSLITKTYVITSAMCVKVHDRKLVAVRLGDNNMKNISGLLEDVQFYDDSHAESIYGIEKIVVHPDFIVRPRANDIALLRLNRTVTYSDFIRPICLPTPGTKLANVGDFLTISDWERFFVTHKKVPTLLVKLITLQECAAENILARRFLTDNHICTKEPENNSTEYCHVHSGSSVMFSANNQWHLEGISFGINSCKPIPIPQVHTKVVTYLEWIENSIEP